MATLSVIYNVTLIVLLRMRCALATRRGFFYVREINFLHNKSARAIEDRGARALIKLN